MNMKVFNIIVFIFQFPAVISLKIYKSDFKFPNEKLISGLVYQKSAKHKNFMSNEFTACIRTKLEKLGTDESAILLLIEDVKDIQYKAVGFDCNFTIFYTI